MPSAIWRGASPRAAVHLLNATKANSRLAGREYPTTDDVVEMAPYVLCHRLIVDGVDPRDVVAASLQGGA